MNKKKLTVYDLLQLKGKKQIHDVYVNNVEEAIAAEEAGIDMIVTAYGMPQHGIYGTFCLTLVLKLRSGEMMSAPFLKSSNINHKA